MPSPDLTQIVSVFEQRRQERKTKKSRTPHTSYVSSRRLKIRN